jgi:Tol biopolymer transport system component
MQVQEGINLEARLVQEVIPMREADFSPDGKWIAFESWPEGNDHDIFVMILTGMARLRLENLLTQEPVLEFDPTWRP